MFVRWCPYRVCWPYHGQSLDFSHPSEVYRRREAGGREEMAGETKVSKAGREKVLPVGPETPDRSECVNMQKRPQFTTSRNPKASAGVYSRRSG